MGYNLYVDDERTPPTDREYVLVRSAGEAKKVILAQGFPDYISFDFWLGVGSFSGMTLLKWIIDHDKEHDVITRSFRFKMHSSNPDAREEMRQLLQTHLDTKFRNL